MARGLGVVCLAGLLAGLPALEARGAQPDLSVRVGDVVPDLSFDALASADDYGGLGLERSAGPVKLSDIPGSLLLLEFFNQHCLNCQRQAPYVEQFHRAVAEGDLAGKVRILGVGVGNRLRDLQGFRQRLHLTYPMAADPEFDRYLSLGDPGGTPFTLFLLRRDGRWVLADSHSGVEGDTELLARSRVLLEGRAGDAALRAASPSAARNRHPLPLDDTQQRERARALLSSVAGREVEVQALTLPGGVRVFCAVGPGGKPIGLYARFASREPVCDLCHAIHFLYAFDPQGTVRGFDPLFVTKYGNEVWSAEDIAKERGRLVGRKAGELSFDPDVDAVTSATMSSSLIFDEVRRTVGLLPDLPKP